MRNILSPLFLLLLPYSVFSQCAVNAPSSRFDIISKNSIPYLEQVDDMFERMMEVFGLDCNYYFYDDSGAPNATALTDDGNIYLGVNFLEQSFQRGAGITGVYFIMAHEMSHLWQFENPDEHLADIDGTVRYSELQADFMAGYLLAKLGVVNSYNYRQLLTQVWSMGDNNWKNSATHGTPTERIMDTHLGITNFRKSVEDAYTESLSLAPNPDRNEYVAELRFQNGAILYIRYRGAVYNGNGQQIGQITGIPDSNNYRLNFTSQGTNDIIISGQYVYTLQNVLIGKYVEY